MRIKANTLSEIYDAIGGLGGQVAVFDFVCGELGYEVLMTQAIGGQFYDKHRRDHTVVALCWKGCPVLASTVSHVQIELDDVDVSTMGNESHTGYPRFLWLRDKGHWKKIESLSNVAAHEGPIHWLGGNGGAAGMTNFEANDVSIRGIATDYVVRQAPVRADELPLVDGDYMLLFDRNEAHRSFRNTGIEYIEYFAEVLDDVGGKLVVMSGFYPRQILPKSVIRFYMEYRDMDMLCNLVSSCAQFLSPYSGVGEAALFMGCNLVLIGGPPGEKQDRHWRIVSRMAEDRGFGFGYFDLS